MPNARETIATAARRAAMLACVFLAGGIAGWVVSERDLLPAPSVREEAGSVAAGDPMPPAGDPAGPIAAAPLAPAPPAAAPAPGGAVPGPLGDVAVGPAVVGDSGVATPIPTTGELTALRAALVVPVAGVARSELRDTFHERRDGGARPHHALDIPAPRGTPVLSAAAGRVLKLFTSDAGGLMVYAADPSERFVLVYSHLDRYADGLREGMPLRQGQPLGAVGTTGNAPANVPHLHFAVTRTDDVARWWRGTPVDPRALLAP